MNFSMANETNNGDKNFFSTFVQFRNKILLKFQHFYRFKFYDKYHTPTNFNNHHNNNKLDSKPKKGNYMITAHKYS